ncbi:TonB-dependent receptor [Fulvivirgaceae bacterium PWU4]|uniref:TonB-dependent receptor n=1 Tax=Chryseosolibacter histidini TaxID=2782349 RepID=A0AAP2DGD7_9BACT|nr:TonB-dependent receptor [Chryseosolibacter histidini]MBT1695745.1 TonB-dependent receptor [Chryseosolibacter histidini]
MSVFAKGIAAATVVVVACVNVALSQQLMGLVTSRNEQGLEEALAGANVRWLGTTTGTATGENGIFMINRVAGADKLVISFTGFISDTLTITYQTNVKVELRSLQQLKEVTVEGWKPTAGMDHSKAISTVVMQEKELFKAACCNLSESFETNPAVDVAFTDAITGTRQIQMLGLSGPNTLISIENMPGVRGLASSQGIQFIPGTWINSIEVTKGVGPVVNGYESIAGQLNVELKKPQESDKLYINGYLNQSGRSEANLNYTAMAGKKWATTFLLHGSIRPWMMDQNDDGFLDFPTGSQLNAINRWVFNSGKGWLGQFGIKVLKDDKMGGQKDFEPAMDKFSTNRYGFEINTQRTEVWGKLGYQFPAKPYKSIGLQLSNIRHQHDSYYGFNVHNATERSGYANLIYQSIIGSTHHKFKTGLSFLFDSYDERLLTLADMKVISNGTESLVNILNFDRLERVPGAFVEYTYDHLDKISIVAGVRVDRHNLFGTLFTPRLHARFNLSETSALRLSAGKGTRVANVLIENSGILVSSRQLVFSGLQSDKAYGFKPDVAWNYGLNFSQDFTLNYRPGTITLDYFYTDFKNQVVLDMDKSVREANFYGLEGKSFSHSLQFQVDYQLMRRFDVRMAYRWLDVKTDYATGLLARPLIAGHRAFMNLAYETKSKWKFDYTLQWLGKQRIPDTAPNPEAYRLSAYSPGYVLMNAQVTKDLKERWSVYAGVENIGNYRLQNPIVSAAKPFSPYFDSSMVWGPIFGRMAYAGFRYRVK